MTEQPDQEDVQQDRPVAEIVFQGRTLVVHMPTPEQILVWQRTLKRLQSANPESWSGVEVVAALERARQIVDSILVDLTDVDWMDGEMLAGRLTLKEASQIIPDAIDAFQNRAERRHPAKKTPAKKATRKRAK